MIINFYYKRLDSSILTKKPEKDELYDMIRAVIPDIDINYDFECIYEALYDGWTVKIFMIFIQ